MILRYEDCDKKIFPEKHYLWDSWRCLWFYLELQFTEGEITKETFELLTGHLLRFKQFAVDDE
jgi:hypothetical protein